MGVAMPMMPSAAASPTIALDPSLALPGTVVRLRGDNLPPHARFLFTWDGQPTSAGVLEANGRGVIRARFTVPADLPGRHEFAAIPAPGQTGLDAALPLATAAFVVAEVGDPTPSVPADVEGLATGEPDPDEQRDLDAGPQDGCPARPEARLQARSAAGAQADPAAFGRLLVRPVPAPHALGSDPHLGSQQRDDQRQGVH